MQGSAETAKELGVLDEPKGVDRCTHLFEVPHGQRNLEDRQSLVLPLARKELHLIEIKDAGHPQARAG